MSHLYDVFRRGQIYLAVKSAMSEKAVAFWVLLCIVLSLHELWVVDLLGKSEDQGQAGVMASSPERTPAKHLSQVCSFLNTFLFVGIVVVELLNLFRSAILRLSSFWGKGKRVLVWLRGLCACGKGIMIYDS